MLVTLPKISILFIIMRARKIMKIINELSDVVIQYRAGATIIELQKELKDVFTAIEALFN